MHYTLKSVLCIILIIIFSGCSLSPGVDISDRKYETDIAAIDIQIPELKNLQNSEFEEKFNSDYSAAADKWIADFTSQCPEAPPEKCVFRLSQEIMYNSAPFISIVGELYSFTEGIHGTSDRITKNIDTKKCVEIKLADLFSDSQYEKMINREITKILEANKDEYSDLWEKPILTSAHQECFYFSEDGLVIYYPPYELSYYARGFVEFCIPYAEICGYLRDEYRAYFQ